MHTKEKFGWIPVPRDRSNVPSAEEVHKMDREWFSDPLESWPDTDVTKKAREYAQQELPRETFNHSMRVFCYGAYYSDDSMYQYPILTLSYRYSHHNALFRRVRLERLFRNLGIDMPVP
jgi:hypothetical protein